jgi:transposase
VRCASSIAGAANAHFAQTGHTVADGAGWQGAKAVSIPDKISRLHLPPYSPELNPVGNVCTYLRADTLAIAAFDS